jgi:hypothetical protein
MHREAKRFENEIAHDLSGRRVFLSGAGMEKADVRRRSSYLRHKGRVEQTDTFSFRVEAKTTRRATYTFTVRDWNDLVRVADPAGEIPIFCVKFVAPRGVPSALSIVRAPLAAELGLIVALSEVARPRVVRKTCALGSTAVHTKLLLPDLGPRGDLAIVRYHDLVEKLRNHAHFG